MPASRSYRDKEVSHDWCVTCAFPCPIALQSAPSYASQLTSQHDASLCACRCESNSVRYTRCAILKLGHGQSVLPLLKRLTEMHTPHAPPFSNCSAFMATVGSPGHPLPLPKPAKKTRGLSRQPGRCTCHYKGASQLHTFAPAVPVAALAIVSALCGQPRLHRRSGLKLSYTFKHNRKNTAQFSSTRASRLHSTGPQTELRRHSRQGAPPAPQSIHTPYCQQEY